MKNSIIAAILVCLVALGGCKGGGSSHYSDSQSGNGSQSGNSMGSQTNFSDAFTQTYKKAENDDVTDADPIDSEQESMDSAASNEGGYDAYFN